MKICYMSNPYDYKEIHNTGVMVNQKLVNRIVKYREVETAINRAWRKYMLSTELTDEMKDQLQAEGEEPINNEELK